MIVEKTFEFCPEKIPFTYNEVESFIKKMGLKPVRWAINERKGDKFILSVSGIETLK